MALSNYVFESGDAIEVGSHGDHSYVYHSGNPVLDSGRSNYVFESGTGLGGQSIQVTLSQGGSDLVTTPVINDSTYRSGGIGWFADSQGSNPDSAFFNSAKLKDGTVIDDFADGDLSEYGGLTSYASVSGGVLEQDPEQSSGGESTAITSKSGLNYYPQPGDEFTFDVTMDENVSGAGFTWAAQNFTNSTGQIPDGYDASIGLGGGTDNEFFVRKVENGNTTKLYDAVVSLSAGTKYEFTVTWL